MNDSAVITAPADTSVPAVAPDDTTEAWTLLDKLAAIAVRATKGDGLPAEMADKLDELARACRDRGPVIEHPSWCDPRHCFSEDEPDGTIAVGHHRVLLEEFDCDVHIPGMRPDRVVSVIRFDNYYTDGSIDSEGATMFLDVPQHGEFMGDAARRYARAVAVAGEIVGSDVLPDGCKLYRPRVSYANPD